MDLRFRRWQAARSTSIIISLCLLCAAARSVSAQPSSTTVRTAQCGQLSPTGTHVGDAVLFTNCASATTCTTSPGPYENWCQSNGTTWAVSGGGAGGVLQHELYGGNYANLNLLVAAHTDPLGNNSAPQTAVLDAPLPTAGNVALTVPPTLRLEMRGAGRIDCASLTTAKLTLQGGLPDEPRQLFVNCGTVINEVGTTSSYTTALSFTGNAFLARVFPQWWGAVANGAADDTPALNWATLTLSQGSRGGQVYLPAGTYFVRCNSAGRPAVRLFSNIALVGESHAAIIKVDPAQANDISNVTLGVGNLCRVVGVSDSNTTYYSDIVLDNFTVDGSMATATRTNQEQCHAVFFSTGTVANFSRVWIERLWIHDTCGDGIRGGKFVSGYIDRNIVTGYNRSGINFIGGTSDLYVTNNYAYPNPNQTNLDCGITSEPTSGQTLDHVWFVSNHTNILCMGGSSITVRATNIHTMDNVIDSQIIANYLDKFWIERNTIYNDDPYFTYKDALTISGATYGTVSHNHIWQKYAYAKDPVTTNTINIGSAIQLKSPVGMSLRTGFVTIDHNDIHSTITQDVCTQNSVAIDIAFGIHVADAGDVTVENNTIEGNFEYGIKLEPIVQGTYNNRVLDNTVKLTGASCAAGLYVKSAAGVVRNIMDAARTGNLVTLTFTTSPGYLVTHPITAMTTKPEWTNGASFSTGVAPSTAVASVDDGLRQITYAQTGADEIGVIGQVAGTAPVRAAQDIRSAVRTCPTTTTCSVVLTLTLPSSFAVSDVIAVTGVPAGTTAQGFNGSFTVSATSGNTVSFPAPSPTWTLSDTAVIGTTTANWPADRYVIAGNDLSRGTTGVGDLVFSGVPTTNLWLGPNTLRNDINPVTVAGNTYAAVIDWSPYRFGQDHVFEGASAHSLREARRTASNTAGNDFTLQAGGASVGATDKAGGNLVLSAGECTGNCQASGGAVILKSTPRAAPSTSDNTPLTRLTIPFDGGAQWATATRPTCDTAHRGTVFFQAVGGAGPDTFEVCTSTDGGSTYVWSSSLGGSGSGGGATLDISPTTNVVIEEFYTNTITSGSVGGLGWDTAQIASGGALVRSGPVANHFGIYFLPTTATAGSGNWVALSQGGAGAMIDLTGATGWEANFVFRLNAVTGTAQNARVGFALRTDWGVAAATKGIFLRFDTALGTPDTTWMYVCADGTTTNAVSSALGTPIGGGVPTAGWYTLRIRSVVAGHMLFSLAVNGGTPSAEVDVSGNCPLAADALSPGFQTIANAGGVAAGMSIDRFAFKQTGVVR